jgi:hypothetical protein
MAQKLCFLVFLWSLSVFAQNDGFIENEEFKNIIGIELIEAGKSKSAIESRFGHVMVRLVTNQDMLKDLVLNFGANTQDEDINYMKGLFGGYEMSFSLTTLEQTWWQYAVIESRVLKRYPIKLSYEHLDNLNRLLSDYKQSLSQKDYKFLSYNCAHAVIDFLQDIGLNLSRGTRFPLKVSKKNYQFQYTAKFSDRNGTS